MFPNPWAPGGGSLHPKIDRKLVKYKRDLFCPPPPLKNDDIRRKSYFVK